MPQNVEAPGLDKAVSRSLPVSGSALIRLRTCTLCTEYGVRAWTVPKLEHYLGQYGVRRSKLLFILIFDVHRAQDGY